jgi:hypothetical protein
LTDCLKILNKIWIFTSEWRLLKATGEQERTKHRMDVIILILNKKIKTKIKDSASLRVWDYSHDICYIILTILHNLNIAANACDDKQKADLKI